ncbi:MAG: OmpH family outer membrane protein [Pseudomonadota bacterium]
MKPLFKFFASATLAAMAVMTTPAAAQVEGKVATSSISNSILGVPSFQTALSQVSTTYAAQIEQLQTKRTELDTLLKPFDTNGNGTIDQGAETAAIQGAANLQQIQTLRAEINGLENQITAAQVYAVEQVLAQYQAALNEVATQQQIVMIVEPNSLLYAAEGADITAAVSTALAGKVSAVGIVPPAGWQPSNSGVQIFQEIQRTLLVQEARARAAQQQQQQQGNTEAPAGR